MDAKTGESCQQESEQIKKKRQGILTSFLRLVMKAAFERTFT